MVFLNQSSPIAKKNLLISSENNVARDWELDWQEVMPITLNRMTKQKF